MDTRIFFFFFLLIKNAVLIGMMVEELRWSSGSAGTEAQLM